MDKRGNIMINLLIFLMALAVLVMFIGPMQWFLALAQNSHNLNCAGYTDVANPHNSYNASLNTDTISCMAIKLYLPYIVLAFLIAGVAKLLYDSGNILGGGGDTGGF